MGNQVSKTSEVALAPNPVLDEKRAAVKQYAVQSTARRLAESGTAAVPALTADKLQSWASAFDDTPTLKLSQLLLTNADPTATLIPRSTQIADQLIFNTELKGIKTDDKKKGEYPGPITNQKSSGRCWLFATTNVLRYRIVSQLLLGDFQLSQSYLFFYDKLEKSNYYLENMIDLIDEPLDSRVVWHMNGDPISDGGQADMAVNLLLKYGCLPQTLYPESFSSSASSKMDGLLVSKLREFTTELRALKKSMLASGVAVASIDNAMRRRKDEMMATVYNILSICLGTPPKPDAEFTWEYYDRDGKFCSLTTTPKAFYRKYTGPNYFDESFSIVNDPRHAYDRLYTVDRLGNVAGGRPVLYVNAPMHVLEQAVIACIKADQPVFFGCDVGAFLVRDSGVMDVDAYDYELAFNTKLGMTKAQRIDTHESMLTHAMTICAIHLDQSGQPVRYKIENSWSNQAGQKGFFVCTAEWFRQYTYQVVIPKTHAPDRYVKILERGGPEVWPVWDPMGSLA